MDREMFQTILQNQEYEFYKNIHFKNGKGIRNILKRIVEVNKKKETVYLISLLEMKKIL